MYNLARLLINKQSIYATSRVLVVGRKLSGGLSPIMVRKRYMYTDPTGSVGIGGLKILATLVGTAIFGANCYLTNRKKDTDPISLLAYKYCKQTYALLTLGIVVFVASLRYVSLPVQIFVDWKYSLGFFGLYLGMVFGITNINYENYPKLKIFGFLTLCTLLSAFFATTARLSGLEHLINSLLMTAVPIFTGTCIVGACSPSGTFDNMHSYLSVGLLMLICGYFFNAFYQNLQLQRYLTFVSIPLFCLLSAYHCNNTSKDAKLCSQTGQSFDPVNHALPLFICFYNLLMSLLQNKMLGSKNGSKTLSNADKSSSLLNNFKRSSKGGFGFKRRR